MEKVKIYLWTATSGILGVAPRVENPLPEVAGLGRAVL